MEQEAKQHPYIAPSQRPKYNQQQSNSAYSQMTIKG